MFSCVLLRCSTVLLRFSIGFTKEEEEEGDPVSSGSRSPGSLLPPLVFASDSPEALRRTEEIWQIKEELAAAAKLKWAQATQGEPGAHALPILQEKDVRRALAESQSRCSEAKELISMIKKLYGEKGTAKKGPHRTKDYQSKMAS